MFIKEMTCIVCPVGCKLKISKVDDEFIVEGNNCERGEKYGINEMTNPLRVVTSTVKINNVKNKMVPVKTTDGIPKEKIMDLMEKINKIKVDLPVKRGDILLENLYDTGVSLVITRDIG